MAYQEIQQFKSLSWLWLFIVPAVLGLWYSAYWELTAGAKTNTMLGWLILGTAFLLLFPFCGMRTQVNAQGLTVESYPLPLLSHHIPHADIATYEARQYRPLLEFGGWGIRWGLGGKAYTVSGNQGVQLTLKGSKRLLIGSGQPRQLITALDHYRPDSPQNT